MSSIPLASIRAYSQEFFVVFCKKIFYLNYNPAFIGGKHFLPILPNCPFFTKISLLKLPTYKSGLVPLHGRRACGHHFPSLPTNPSRSHVRERERDLPTDRRADGKVHQRFHFTPPEVHARGYIAIISSLIEYLLAKLLSFQGFIVLFGVGSLSSYYLLFKQ
ncbi:hypothetical protein ACIA3Z_09030 [Lactobacillus delbrueckii subsp. bulgaricus]